MLKDYDLNVLRTKEHEAYKLKQSLWNAFTEARERTRNAYEAMQEAWLERRRTREVMNHEYKKVQYPQQNFTLKNEAPLRPRFRYI